MLDYSKLSILVVDDQTLVRSLLAQLLKGLGFAVDHVHQAVDGLSALRSLNVRAVDVVLCDISMLPLNGLDLLKELRMGRPLATPSNVPFIFLSGHAERHNVELAAGLDADGFVVKPPKPVDIEKALGFALTRPRPAPDPFRYTHIATGSEYDRSHGFRLGVIGPALVLADDACFERARPQSLSDVGQDALLAEDLVSPTGRLLLRRGKRITAAQLAALRERPERFGVVELVIEDEDAPA
ncbi:response regulator transcription factor [Crenobacter cavernae]|uniref:Response regulator n=1 Tax=Crenobacter cavernae TaxID=2290923 RepID=A0ABY0FBR8_9NEIS|nr:response regulator [Crenobacter cavernae]RXZ43486.1 response regulator [Crenobacter cavernae]